MVRLWKCETMSIMKKVEASIKRLADHMGIRVKKYGQTEIITTNDIGYIITMIDKYVSEQNTSSRDVMRLKMIELEIKSKQEDNESLRLQIQLLGLQNSIVVPAVTRAPPTIMQPMTGRNTGHTSIPITSMPVPRTILPLVDENDTESDSVSSIDAVDEQVVVPADDQQQDNAAVVPPSNVQPVVSNVAAAPVIQPPITTTTVVVSKPPTRRQQVTTEWIRTHQPTSGELTTGYYKRYTGAVQKPLTNKTFEPIAIKVLGRKPAKVSSNVRRW